MNQIEIHNASWKLKLKKAGGTVKGKKPGSVASKVMERNQNRICNFDPVVFLLIDVSGSMDGDPLAFAKRGAIQFARDAFEKGYKVGVICFGCKSHLISKPTSQLAGLNKKIKKLEIQGSTNMSAGLFDAYCLLKGPQHRNTSVVLVTDGFANDPDRALDVARSLKARKINILTLGTEYADFEFLKRIATSSELACSTSTAKLVSGITSMAKLLPGS